MQEIKSRGLTRDAIKMIAMLTMFSIISAMFF